MIKVSHKISSSSESFFDSPTLPLVRSLLARNKHNIGSDNPYQLLSRFPTYMSLDLIPVEPGTFLQVERNGRPVIVYPCKLQGDPCGLFVEGTTSAVAAHLREHGITGPDNSSTCCTWERCSKSLKKGSMTRHILTHFGVKVRCSACGVIRCRHDLLQAHIKSSELCQLASIEMVDGPEGRLVVPASWSLVNSDM